MDFRTKLLLENYKRLKAAANRALKNASKPRSPRPFVLFPPTGKGFFSGQVVNRTGKPRPKTPNKTPASRSTARSPNRRTRAYTGVTPRRLF